MANQVLTPKVVRDPHVGKKIDFISRVAVALGILALVVITALTLRSGAATDDNTFESTISRSALPQDGRAFFTEPYWNMARDSSSSVGIEIGKSALPQDGRAYFTEPYWEMGAAKVTLGLSALPQDGRAYFTEPYWEMGSMEKDEQPATATEPEWSYYTEQYWDRTR